MMTKTYIEPAIYNEIVREVKRNGRLQGIPESEAKLCLDYHLGYTHVMPPSYNYLKPMIEEVCQKWQS